MSQGKLGLGWLETTEKLGEFTWSPGACEGMASLSYTVGFNACLGYPFPSQLLVFLPQYPGSPFFQMLGTAQ